MSSLLCCIPRETPEFEIDIDCKITCCTEQTLERRRSMKRDGVDGVHADKEVKIDRSQSVGCCCCRRIKRQAKLKAKDETNNE